MIPGTMKREELITAQCSIMLLKRVSLTLNLPCKLGCAQTMKIRWDSIYSMVLGFMNTALTQLFVRLEPCLQISQSI